MLGSMRDAGIWQARDRAAKTGRGGGKGTQKVGSCRGLSASPLTSSAVLGLQPSKLPKNWGGICRKRVMSTT